MNTYRRVVQETYATNIYIKTTITILKIERKVFEGSVKYL